MVQEAAVRATRSLDRSMLVSVSRARALYDRERPTAAVGHRQMSGGNAAKNDVDITTDFYFKFLRLSTSTFFITSFSRWRCSSHS